MTETILVALACGLAGHRVWRIFAKDFITGWIRLWLEERADHSRAATYLLTLITCPWCIGWWAAGALVAWTAWAIELDWRLALLAWPMASSVTGFIAKVDES